MASQIQLVQALRGTASHSDLNTIALMMDYMMPPRHKGSSDGLMISLLSLSMWRDKRLLEHVLGNDRPYQQSNDSLLGFCQHHHFAPPRPSENWARPVLQSVTAAGSLLDSNMVEDTTTKEASIGEMTRRLLSEGALEPPDQRSSITEQTVARKRSTTSQTSLAIKWLSSLEELRCYKEQHGDCIVPRGYAANPKLASWVAEQRKQYKLMKTGNQSSITMERIELLNELGFAWNAQEDAWKRHIGDLWAFSKENGHCHVPLNHKKYPKLGLWVKEQRRHYTLMTQGKQSHMNEERVKALTDICFCWDTHEAAWMERFRELVEFKQVYGTCSVPSGYCENPKLGTWVQHQRRQYKRFKDGKSDSYITKERIDALEKLGFVWNPREGRSLQVAFQSRANNGPGSRTTTSSPGEVRLVGSVSSSYSTCSTRSSTSEELVPEEPMIVPSPKRRRMS